ncbi:hypothetical protein MRB53_022481 [Persea americana]|uniref:Uncharacterized protein n=1 Tax=Persea americana TaxID=3435 RepID=A0ACC2L7Y5_PERAE|nr:hypothetical protein MRB53_022481 [Persea americana]
MKISICAAALVACLVVLPVLVPARPVARTHPHHSHHHQSKHPRPVKGEAAKLNLYQERGQVRERSPDTVEVAGSSLPDCSHACGSCSPCRLVMVSFICAAEAETCPMAYKCMCHSKSYPVP